MELLLLVLSFIYHCAFYTHQYLYKPFHDRSAHITFHTAKTQIGQYDQSTLVDTHRYLKKIIRDAIKNLSQVLLKIWGLDQVFVICSSTEKKGSCSHGIIHNCLGKEDTMLTQKRPFNVVSLTLHRTWPTMKESDDKE